MTSWLNIIQCHCNEWNEWWWPDLGLNQGRGGGAGVNNKKIVSWLRHYRPSAKKCLMTRAVLLSSSGSGQFRSSRSLSPLSAMFIEEIIFAGPSPGPGPPRQIVTFVTCGLRVARRYPRYSAHLDSSSRSLYTREADLCLASDNQF